MELVDIPIGTDIPVGLVRRLPNRLNNVRDITGWTLGKLRVIGYVGKIKEYKSPASRLYWLCICECGRFRIIRSNGTSTINRCRHCTILDVKRNRKKKKSNRAFVINIRMSYEERKQIKKYAESLNMTTQQFCLQTLLRESSK